MHYFFYQNSPKLKLFLQKNAKTLSAGGFPPRPPLASGDWGLRPQAANTQPPPLQIPGYAPAIPGYAPASGDSWLRACMAYYCKYY